MLIYITSLLTLLLCFASFTTTFASLYHNQRIHVPQHLHLLPQPAHLAPQHLHLMPQQSHRIPQPKIFSSSILLMFVHWKFWTRMTSSNSKYDLLLHIKYKLWFESCFVYVLIIIISKSTLIGITFVLEYFNFVIKHTWTMWCVADD